MRVGSFEISGAAHFPARALFNCRNAHSAMAKPSFYATSHLGAVVCCLGADYVEAMVSGDQNRIRAAELAVRAFANMPVAEMDRRALDQGGASS